MKKLIYGAALLFIFAGCEKDSLEENTTTKTSANVALEPSKQTYVTIADVPQLIPSIQRYNPAYDYLTSGDYTNPNSRSEEELDLDLDHILKVVDQYGKESYSIVIKKYFTEYEDHYFENLQIFEKDGVIQEKILKYNAEDDSKVFDMKTFTGTVEMFDKERNIEGIFVYVDGVQRCEKVTIGGCIHLWFMGNGDLWIWSDCPGGGGGDDGGGGNTGGDGGDGTGTGGLGGWGYGNGTGGTNNNPYGPNPHDPTMVDHHVPVAPNLPMPMTNPTFFKKPTILFTHLGINDADGTIREWLTAHEDFTNGIYFQFLESFYDTEMRAMIKEVILTSKLLDMDCTPFLSHIPDYEAQMSAPELTLFRSMPKNRQIWYLAAAQKAVSVQQEQFPATMDEPCNAHNGKGDAVRHACWNAIATGFLGAELTQQLTTLHEERPFEYPLQYKEKDMDLYNNAAGRAIALYSTSASDAITNVINALNDGNLRYLSNLNENCRPTTDSYSIPTNQ